MFQLTLGTNFQNFLVKFQNTATDIGIMSDIAIARFAALAHEVRYKAFRLLASEGTNGVCAGDISKELDVSPSTLSPHLAQLERCGLLTKIREGTRIVYAINPDNVSELLDHLISDCCGGRPELCGGAANTTSHKSEMTNC